LNEKEKILLVDDEPVAVRNLEHILKSDEFDIMTADNGPDALKLIRENEFDVVLTDLRMAKVDGMKILQECKRLRPLMEVIMITGYATVDSAIEAMKYGAYHYVPKPYRNEEVRKVVNEAVEKVRLKKENLTLKEHLEKLKKGTGVHIVTHDSGMRKVLDTALQVASADCNVLITGESGTGKELMARFIHENSMRKNGPLMAVNCGAFTEELLANELFGHEKGAYTGAAASRAGIVEAANGGILFLDEITEMSPGMQVKLLRVIQEKQTMRLGGTKPIDVDVRFIGATNRKFQDALEEGEFREDLYYRMNVVSLQIPPLSARKGDIPLLCQYFLAKHSKLMGRDMPTLSSDALEILKKYGFPGNVRELENIIERGIVLAGGGGVIEPEHLPEDIMRYDVSTFRGGKGKLPSLKEMEAKYIQEVLKETDGNKTHAASIMGIARLSLIRKLKKFEEGENPEDDTAGDN
jgi:two-component system response regulator HydG